MSPKALTAEEVRTMVSRDLTKLAPRFRDALLLGLHDCWRAGYDPVVYEAMRSNAVQQAYYALGRTAPGQIVTYAADARWSWHFYGLSVDVISRARGWKTTNTWRAEVSTILKNRGLAWGGDWTRPDLPHFQFGGLAARPKSAPDIYANAGGGQAGLHAVWAAVNAL